MEDFSKESPSPGIHQREAVVASVYRKLGLEEDLRKRWIYIGYQPPVPVQLKLWS